MSQNQDVNIRIDEGGIISVDPEVVTLPPDAVVSWHCPPQVEFCVEFPQGSPFAAASAWGEGGRLTARVLAQAPAGRYKYNIRVVRGAQSCTIDPWIIVTR